ncbi:MAG TPA: hypothetical protein VMP03_10560 [Methylomirabilota bacterium]|nr:hypothetical protein [Methylomirabilota bacterium]
MTAGSAIRQVLRLWVVILAVYAMALPSAVPLDTAGQARASVDREAGLLCIAAGHDTEPGGGKPAHSRGHDCCLAGSPTLQASLVPGAILLPTPRLNGLAVERPGGRDGASHGTPERHPISPRAPPPRVA